MRMEGKIALVSGGAGGIGSAICRLFAAEGAKVTVADIDSGRGSALLKRSPRLGEKLSM